MSARDEILGRVRAALAEHPVVVDDVPARTAPPVPDVELFRERAADYRAVVTAVADDAGAVRTAVADACARHGVARLAVPHDLRRDWRPEDLRIDELGADPDVAALDAVDGVLTTCAGAIALTGTVFLDGGPGQGARATTLVPDLHICVVPAELVVADVGQAIARLAASVRAAGRAMTLISGPSATSDIELDRVEGVHGPRRLELVITG